MLSTKLEFFCQEAHLERIDIIKPAKFERQRSYDHEMLAGHSRGFPETFGCSGPFRVSFYDHGRQIHGFRETIESGNCIFSKINI